MRILHAPSHPEAKGTPRIRAAIERMLADGLPIDYVEITGRPNADVMRELANCDLVVDQLFSDTPMASFATEAAHFGKPALVGAYGAALFARYAPAEFIPPSATCHPDDLEGTLRQLVTNPDEMRAIGARAQQFVRTQWAATAVAARYLRLIGGDIPAEWTFDPADVQYVHGCALDEARARALVAAVISRGGQAALHLDDKPALREQFTRFASTEVAAS